MSEMRVQCYSGYRADETPLRFVLRGRELVFHHSQFAIRRQPGDQQQDQHRSAEGGVEKDCGARCSWLTYGCGDMQTPP